MKYFYKVLHGENGFIKFLNMTTNKIVFSPEKLLQTNPKIISTEILEPIHPNKFLPALQLYQSIDIVLESKENIN